MRTYHYNWLNVHPTRSEQWLKYMLSEGFDMHHVDGNHNNDNPYNLALVYGQDHARMHANGLVATKQQKRWTFHRYFMVFFITYIVLYCILRLT